MRRNRSRRTSSRTYACTRRGLVALAALLTSFSVWTTAGRPSTADASIDPHIAYGTGQLMAVTPNGGYWTATWSGEVSPHSGAPWFGSPATSSIALSKPVVGMATTLDGQGYWLVASDGGIFSFGDAQFYGSTGSIHLNQPIVGMARTADGRGYWLVASDGGVFSFGDALFYGSTGSIHLNQPIVGMAPTPDGRGYWLVASDGGIFSYGDALFFGSTGSIHLDKPIVGMAPTPDGQGYWLVASDGGIFTYGVAQFLGSLGGSGESVLGIIIRPQSAGYSLVTLSGNATAFSGVDNQSTQSVALTGEGVLGDSGISGGSAGIGGGTQTSDCQPTNTPSVAVDAQLDTEIANQLGPGWIGGDATYSTQLPNGQESFVFSDTVIGTAQPSGAAQLTGMISNSELVGSLSDLAGNYGGSYAAPQALIADSGSGSVHWWPSATYVENGVQLIFVNEFAPVNGSMYDTFTGRSAIASMSTPSNGMPSYASMTMLPTDANTQWGSAVTISGGYVYAYGIDSNTSTGAFYGMKVARIPTGETLSTTSWRYWTGSQWAGSESAAEAVPTENELTGVTGQANGQGYVAVSIPAGPAADKTVNLSYACSPQGPWSTPDPIYSIPQVQGTQNEIAYIPTFHPEISSQGGLVVSYNIDTTQNLDTLSENVHLYQPRFLSLSN